MIVGLFTVLAGGAGSDGRAVAVGLALLILGGAVFVYVVREAARLCRQAVEGAARRLQPRALGPVQ
ncbi:hypothetical protein Pyrde_1406 [Pyrodictium delaneyi]|uniref:Uncharacterized protein n=1 Tax=Pyrodictium delaneyi TaxID=1273541 RepID=A0A0P0N3W7_9CREN|nr:hypothetical protein [Pyrodictium delaneyi]ALL01452.1 hypothetical protein Pyrde_1406 [Pyrodictium delaneyi]OWJ54634.1 hypothetical protein Pdsh_06335 [Pyrodictium delaneyi]